MSSQAYNDFIKMNREMLDCYANMMDPTTYKLLEPADQRDFCYTQRVRLEESLIKSKISMKDFMAAANEQ